MEFLPIAILLAASLLTLFVTGLFAQPHAERATVRTLTPRALWSTVHRGNDVLAPTTPYGEFARRT